MTVVLDATVLIDHLRGSSAAAGYLAALAERPACSEVTRIEVLTGLRSAETRPVEFLFSLIAWIPLDEPIARRAGELGRRFRASHQGIDAADFAVAATAQHVEATVATANIKHFPMFPGLQPVY